MGGSSHSRECSLSSRLRRVAEPCTSQCVELKKGNRGLCGMGRARKAQGRAAGGAGQWGQAVKPEVNSTRFSRATLGPNLMQPYVSHFTSRGLRFPIYNIEIASPT